jgi:hypothetical protein
LAFTKPGDYVYNRELTEDELRARHMYWGMAPAHLQKGLPKFDGKDFYPPSPVKGGLRMAVPSSHLSSHVPSEEATPAPDTEAESAQWFRPIPRSKRQNPDNATQSESLPRVTQQVGSEIRRPDSCAAPITRPHASCQKGVASATQASTSTDSKGPSSSDDGDDDKALLFKGRKTMARSR